MELYFQSCTLNDLAPGNSVIDSGVRLIDERCSYVIVVISSSFCDSPNYKFLTSYALSKGIGKYISIFNIYWLKFNYVWSILYIMKYSLK